MFKRTVSAALIFGAAAIAPPAVQAQSTCAPRDVIVDRLQDRYAERLSAGGVQNEKHVVEVWSSEKTGSFTVLLTRANGVSCIIAAGKDWNTVVPAMMQEDVPS